MSIGIVILHAVLAIVVWLMMLNGYLHGTLTAHIEAFLGVCWLGLLVTIFVTYGWQAGLLALPMSVVYGSVFGSSG